jgi:hypothetical protein
VAPFGAQQVADAGDIACNPFDIKEAVGQIERAAVPRSKVTTVAAARVCYELLGLTALGG